MTEERTVSFGAADIGAGDVARGDLRARTAANVMRTIVMDM